jgi:2-polyprenyl-6-methoxyphenol hydroxylase-like FAD-dependent oxidoreductase
MDSEAGKYMGIIPLGGDRYIWFLQFNKNSHPLNDKRPEAIKAYTEQTVSNYPEIFKRLVAETNFNKAFYWVSCRMNLLPRFHHDKLMLAGDAAHPLLPLTSQGANSALQDAAVLASLLSTQQAGEDLEDILAKFYDARSKDIQRYIDKGDFMLRSFLDLRKSKQFNLPLAV